MVWNLIRRARRYTWSLCNIRRFTTEYILGANKSELERLKLLHQYVKPLMLRALDKTSISVNQTNNHYNKNANNINILDVGFGAGYTTHQLYNYFDSNANANSHESHRSPPAISSDAVDSNPKWQEYMETTNSSLIKNNICRFHNVDILNEEELANIFHANYIKFDVIFVRFVLTHIHPSNTKNAIINLYKLLKAGGNIIFQEPLFDSNLFIKCYPRNDMIEASSAKVFNHLKKSNHFNPISPLEILSILRNECNMNIIGIDSMMYGGLNGDPGFELTLSVTQNFINGLYEQGVINVEEKDETIRNIMNLKQDSISCVVNLSLISIIGQSKA